MTQANSLIMYNLKNKIITNLWVFTLLMGLQSHLVYAQVTSEEIDAIVQNSLDSFTVAGVAVAVVKDGKIIHQKGYGVRTFGKKDLVDEHTNFGIASNSKAFTTTALAILVEQGKIAWTDRVVDYIPEFKMYNDYVTQNFNIQDLLTHRSGLGLGIGDLMFFPDGGDFSVDDIINSFQYFEPESAFRTKFDYDNLLYVVAGEVVKRASGMSWEQFVEKHIFGPLHMDNSYASLTYVKENGNTASPHLNKEKNLSYVEPERWDPEKINGAAGGIYSNVNDIANWMLLHLNKGKYGEDLDQQLFSENSQREMWKIHTTLDADQNPRYNSHFRGYGLGWFLTDMKGNLVVSHTGGLMGMLSKTVLVPDLDLGIIVLTNTYLDGAGVFSAVTQSILDKYLELEDFDWVSMYSGALKSNDGEAKEVVAKIWETSKNASLDALDLENFTGMYEDPWFGKVEIFLEDNQIWFKSHRSPKLKGQMFYYKANTFIAKWNDASLVDADAFVMFGLDQEGKAKSIKMKGISPLIDFSYDFEDLDLHRIENH